MADKLKENLMFLRKNKGYTQYEMANMLNISRPAYANYEMGRRTPDCGTLKRLAQIFQTSIDEIVFGAGAGDVSCGSSPAKEAACQRKDGRNIVEDKRSTMEAKWYTMEEKRYTVKEYFAREDCLSYELIEGVLVKRSMPTFRHQTAVLEVAGAFRNYEVSGQERSKVIVGPFCVVLGEGEAAAVVQPDIIVVTDLEKIRDDRCYGAPDIVVEIVSGSAAETDYRKKLAAYDKYGVREYWIVDIDEKRILIHNLKENTPLRISPLHAVAESEILKGFRMNIGELLDRA